MVWDFLEFGIDRAMGWSGYVLDMQKNVESLTEHFKEIPDHYSPYLILKD